MTFVNVGTLGTVPGKRDLLVQILTHRSAELEAAGCLLYEVRRHPTKRGRRRRPRQWTARGLGQVSFGMMIHSAM